MERQFWIGRWMENRIGFHLKEVNPLLQRYWPEVAPQCSGRVLVPLCGKSQDLRWLVERGHDVVGVEFSEMAARDFAKEQGIAFAETKEGSFTVFRAERLAIFVGDFMEFSPHLAGSFDLLYDRAAMIALPSATRERYVLHLKSLLTSNANGLLISLAYEPSESVVPPYSVLENEVRTHFKEFDVRKLEIVDILAGDQRFQERGVRYLHEVVYRLSRSR